MNKSVSIKDIAKATGCCATTVSVALRGKKGVAPDTQKKIEAAARQLGYRPNLMARRLVGSSSNTMGIITDTMRDLFQVSIFSHQEELLKKQGYSTLLITTEGNGQAEPEVIEALLNRGVDGIIINAMILNPLMIERIQELVDQGFPIVALGANPSIQRIDTVSVEDKDGPYRLTRHLVELGHTRIALVSTSVRSGWRFEGYRRALEEAGLPIDPNLQFECEVGCQNTTRIREKLMAFKHSPTAIFAHNDDLAIEILCNLLKAGYHIPADISVVGINDTWYSEFVRVPLTTLRLPIDKVAEETVRYVLNRIDNEALPCQNSVFESQLIVRESTAPPTKETL